MDSSIGEFCLQCGNRATVHVTELRDDEKISRSYCLEHAPPEFRQEMPFSADRTPADEVAFRRQKLALLDQSDIEPGGRAQLRSAIEQMIAEIEGGRRRLGDFDS